MNAVAPRISLVVSTRDRPDRIRALVAALADQELSRSDFEVVVVDNGSAVPVSEALADQVVPDDMALRVLRNPRPGPAASGRNFGWRAASGPVVAFTDDDCRPDQTWLLELLRHSDNGDLRIVQGRTAPDPDHGPPGPFDHTNRVDGPNQLFETCNVAYPRELLERVGGFDESFLYCGEDVDLGWRAKAAGGNLVYAESALVYHAVVPTSLNRRLRRTFQWIEGVRIMRDYPELRGILVHGVFWKRSHAPLIGMLAGLAVSARRRSAPLALMSVVAYVDHCHRQHGEGLRGWGATVQALPQHLAIDSCEVATMLAGSVRYRTLML